MTGLLSRPKFYDNEIVKTVDFENIGDTYFDNLDVIVRMLTNSSVDAIISGFLASQLTTPSLNVLVSEGLAYCASTGKFIYNGDESTPVPFDAAHATYDRIDIIQVRQQEVDAVSTQQRAFRDPATGIISYQLVPIVAYVNTEYSVKKGTPTGSPVAPTADAGWVKIAEVRIRANTTQVLTADIHNATSTESGVANSAWTTETTRTYIVGSLGQINSMFHTHEHLNITSSSTVHGIRQGSGNGFDADKLDGLHIGQTNVSYIPYVDAAGRIGIGRAPTTVTLEVAGNISSYSGATRIAVLGYSGNAAMLGSVNNDAVLFVRNSAEVMRIDTNGYLLLGYTASQGAYKLQVNGGVYASGLYLAGTRPMTFSTALGSIAIKASAGGWEMGTRFVLSNDTDKGGFLAYGGLASLSYYFVGPAYNSAIAYFLPDGKVGIGRSPTTTLLEVAGGISAWSGATRIMTMGYNGTVGTVGSMNNDAVGFLRNNAEVMRFDTNDYLLLGYTSSQGAYKLQVSGAAYVSGNITSAGNIAITGGSISIYGSTAAILYFYENDQTDPTGRWRFVADGGSFSLQKAASAVWESTFWPLTITRITDNMCGIRFDNYVGIGGAYDTRYALKVYGSIVLETSAPIIYFSETDQTDPNGRWRLVADGTNFDLRKATTASWASEMNAISFSRVDDSTIGVQINTYVGIGGAYDTNYALKTTGTILADRILCQSAEAPAGSWTTFMSINVAGGFPVLITLIMGYILSTDSALLTITNSSGIVSINLLAGSAAYASYIRISGTDIQIQDARARVIRM